MNCAIIIKDAKFFGHITQTILSGQYVVYNGKYYEVHEISPDYGIVLRRASDLYSSRRYYRQLRTYHMGKVEQSEMVSSRNVAGMKLMTGCCDFSVDTDGYLDMQDLHDCRTARHVDLREDPKAGSYRRSYHNKRILTVKLPDMDEDMRYTLGLLFSELFRSLYPAGWAYLAVLAKKPEDLEETYSLLTYDLEEENSTENLYIVEDSELDLGLLDSVIRNMPRMMEILEDYLSWHLEKLGEEAAEEEKEQTEGESEEAKKDPYRKEHYFLFGGEKVSCHLKLLEVRDYLKRCGSRKNPLTRARKQELIDAREFDLQAVNTCDFCGLPLSEVSYERLNDGRIRCSDCASSAVETTGEFQEIFLRCLKMMEILYGIKIHAPIQLHVTNAEEVAKQTGIVYKPGTKFAVRAVGYAQMKNGICRIVVENGSPRLAAIETMVHELTHIWQYLNWKDREKAWNLKMEKKAYTAAARDILYEGMTIWVSIQYLYQVGESSYAAGLEQIQMARDDARGAGFRLYAAQYPLVKDMTALRKTPFTEYIPVDLEKVKSEAHRLLG